MSNNKFNMPKKEYEKMVKKGLEHKVEPATPPIHDGETLESCIRGLKKISHNPELREIVTEAIKKAF